MNSFESQLVEAKLLAEFTPDQQAFVDKLIAEYLKKFRGVKDADLKARFEKGDREALKTYREMIAKRQQILDFINEKDEREKMMLPDKKQKRFESFNVGDKVLILQDEFDNVKDAIIIEINKTPGEHYFSVETCDDQQSISGSDPDTLLHLSEEELELTTMFSGGGGESYYKIKEKSISGIDVVKTYVNKRSNSRYWVVEFGFFPDYAKGQVNVIFSGIHNEFGDKYRQSIDEFKINFEKVEDDQD